MAVELSDLSFLKEPIEKKVYVLLSSAPEPQLKPTVQADGSNLKCQVLP